MAKSQATAYGKTILKLTRCSRIMSFRPSMHYMQCRTMTKCDMNGIVLGLYLKEGDKEPRLTPNGEKFDDRTGGKISEIIASSGMTGEAGVGKMFSKIDEEFSSVAVIGLGKEGEGFSEQENLDMDLENVRIAAAVGARFLQLHGAQSVFVDSMEFAEQAAEGAAMAVWRYNVNKRKGARLHIPKLEMYGSTDVDAWTRGLFKAESQNLARRLSDTPANQMTPSIFAQATIDALCPCGVTVEVRTMEWIEEQGLNSFLMVAKGSCEPPMVLEIMYNGGGSDGKSVTFLGKGITFNSGGLCLRNKKGMDNYRASLSGAASVVAAIRAAAALSLPVNLTAVIPLCENMPSGMGAKPGDVVTLLNGQTLCIKHDTSAGVVMMADPTLYAQSTFKPKLTINIGTHAKGVEYGLGGSSTGLWTNNSDVWKHFKKAGAMTGDRVWRMPLWKYFTDLITPNPSYDLCSKGRGPASSCLAAAVLYSLIPCNDWVHLDTRGTGMLAQHGVPPYLLKGSMSGRPTRTLIQFLYLLSKK